MVNRRPICTSAPGRRDRHTSVHGHLRPLLSECNISVCFYNRVRGFRRVRPTSDGISCLMGASNSLSHGMGAIRNAGFYGPRTKFAMIDVRSDGLSFCLVGKGKGVLCRCDQAEWCRQGEACLFLIDPRVSLCFVYGTVPSVSF